MKKAFCSLALMLIIFAPSDVVAERVLAEFPPILNMFPMNRSRMFP